jgi:hypothetical protein
MKVAHSKLLGLDAPHMLGRILYKGGAIETRSRGITLKSSRPTDTKLLQALINATH